MLNFYKNPELCENKYYFNIINVNNLPEKLFLLFRNPRFNPLSILKLKKYYEPPSGLYIYIQFYYLGKDNGIDFPRIRINLLIMIISASKYLAISSKYPTISVSNIRLVPVPVAPIIHNSSDFHWGTLPPPKSAIQLNALTA